MKWKNLFAVAFKSIRKNGMRSVLTMLGMIIGVSAVIIMVAVGQGTQVNLDASNSTDNVGIISYTWTIHEGPERFIKTGLLVNHTFNWSGTYLVELTVLDAAGLSNTAELQVVALDTEPPVAVASEDQRVLEGTKVFFNATNSTDNEGIERYTWTFNYNQAQVELKGDQVSHTFELKGTYYITLTVEDHSGNTATGRRLA